MTASSCRTRGPLTINFVSFVLPPANLHDFLAMCLVNAETSLREEEGVISFDVLLNENQPNTVILHEIYKDRAAYESHRSTPHFLTFVQGVKDLGAQRTAIVATEYIPTSGQPLIAPNSLGA